MDFFCWIVNMNVDSERGPVKVTFKATLIKYKRSLSRTWYYLELMTFECIMIHEYILCMRWFVKKYMIIFDIL